MVEKRLKTGTWTITRVEIDPETGTPEKIETPIGENVDNPYSKFVMELIESFEDTLGNDERAGVTSFARTGATVSRQNKMESFLRVFRGEDENHFVLFRTTVDESGELFVAGFRILDVYEVVLGLK